MTRQIVLVWTSICIFGSITSAQAATSQTAAPKRYHNEEFGFSVTIPAGWKDAPKQLMTMLNAGAQAHGKDGEVEFLRMYLAPSRQFVPPACVGIGVVHYPKGRQPSKRELRKIISEMTGANLQEICRSAGRRSLASNVEAVSESTVEYDEDEKTFIWQVRAEISGAGSQQARNAGFFGREICVCIASVAQEARFDDFKHIFARIESSFEFDPGMEYKEIKWHETRALPIAVIVVAVLVLVRVFKRA